MAADTADAQRDAGVLDRAIGIKQPRADRANSSRKNGFDDAVEPARLYRFHIVIQDQNDFPGGGLCSSIDETRKIEVAVVGDGRDAQRTPRPRSLLPRSRPLAPDPSRSCQWLVELYARRPQRSLRTPNMMLPHRARSQAAMPFFCKPGR